MSMKTLSQNLALPSQNLISLVLVSTALMKKTQGG